ncbi:PF20097 family protein [Clostridium sp.]|uniref:PF20097 family protein n=1 Tax=Clostridium sp. TaxID=1506 RepID=UPI002FCA5BDB
MECPYCNETMEKGVIYGDRYALKWIEESRAEGFMARIFQKGIKLTNPWMSNKLETYYCSKCKKMIIDVIDIVE